MTKTESICPVCQKKLEAELTRTDGKILVTKTCPEHGAFSSTHWQSPRVFDFAEEYDFFKHFEESNSKSSVDGCPYTCESCSGHISGTVIGVIDVTKRCDLKCAICFSTFPKHEVAYEPTKEEIIKILTFLSEANPKPPAILFSGGEPLERPDMPEIIEAAHKLKFMTILATNGVRLGQSPDVAAKLKKSGLNIVYLQFDSLQDEFYEKIRGQKLLRAKFKAIDVCRKFDIEIILVNTLMRSFNDKELGSIIEFSAKNTDIIRGLIFQPVAFTGRATENPFREALREWRFAEDVEAQTHGEIAATDFFPLSSNGFTNKDNAEIHEKTLASVFLQSTVRRCKLDVCFEKNLNRNPDQPFCRLRKVLPEHTENGTECGIKRKARSPFVAVSGFHEISKLVSSYERNRILHPDENHSENAHISLLSVTWQPAAANFSAGLHGFYGSIQLRREPRQTMRDTLRHSRLENHTVLCIQ